MTDVEQIEYLAKLLGQLCAKHESPQVRRGLGGRLTCRATWLGSERVILDIVTVDDPEQQFKVAEAGLLALGATAPVKIEEGSTEPEWQHPEFPCTFTSPEGHTAEVQKTDSEGFNYWEVLRSIHEGRTRIASSGHVTGGADEAKALCVALLGACDELWPNKKES